MVILIGILFIYLKPLNIIAIACLSLLNAYAICRRVYAILMVSQTSQSYFNFYLLIETMLKGLCILFMVFGYKAERQNYSNSIKNKEVIEQGGDIEKNIEIMEESNALDIENRLTILNDLKASGAITEIEYMEKRNQIISDI